MAECYKRAGDCRRALAYYDQFLTEAPKGAQHAMVTKRVAALRPECPAALPSPASVTPPDARPGSEARLEAPKRAAPQAPLVAPAPTPKAAEVKQSTGARETASAAEPHAWQIGLEAGVSNTRWGAISTGVQPSIQIAADRIWWLGNVGLGASIGGRWGLVGYENATFAPEAYEDTATTLETTVSAQLRLRLMRWLAIRLDVGGGLTWVSGFKVWNELGANGAGTGGSIALGTARVGLGADVPLTDNLGLRVTALALSFSPAPAEAREGISQVLTLGGALGVTYGF